MQGLAVDMKDADPAAEKAGAERRRFRRVRVDLPGRLFIPADSREARCTVTDLSPGGAAISCETVPEAGTNLVLYVDGFGRFEGNVVMNLTMDPPEAPPAEPEPPKMRSVGSTKPAGAK